LVSLFYFIYLFIVFIQQIQEWLSLLHTNQYKIGHLGIESQNNSSSLITSTLMLINSQIVLLNI